MYHEVTKSTKFHEALLGMILREPFRVLRVCRVFVKNSRCYVNVAITGAWSLVPTSTCTGQLVAWAASDWLAIT